MQHQHITFHVAYNKEQGAWTIRRDDADRPENVFAQKEEALTAARERAQRARTSELIIYERDGSVQEKLVFEDN